MDDTQTDHLGFSEIQAELKNFPILPNFSNLPISANFSKLKIP